MARHPTPSQSGNGLIAPALIRLRVTDLVEVLLQLLATLRHAESLNLLNGHYLVYPSSSIHLST